MATTGNVKANLLGLYILMPEVKDELTKYLTKIKEGEITKNS